MEPTNGTQAPSTNSSPEGGVWLQALRFHLAVNHDGAYRFSHIRLPYGSAAPCLTETLQELLTGHTIGEVLVLLETMNRPCLPSAELRAYLVNLATQMRIPIGAPTPTTNCGLDCGCDQCGPADDTPPPPPAK